MSAVRAFLCRLAGLFGRRRRERELCDEMEFHLQMQIEANRESGMASEEARRQALLKAGGVAQAKEAYRDRRGFAILETAVRDLRHSLRFLLRSPGFTLMAVLSLALGTGATGAIFALLDRILLRPLPVKEPGQLVMLWTSGPSLGSTQGVRGSSYPMYQDFQQRAQAFSHVFCRYYTPVSISLEGQAERVTGELVSGNYFQALGIGPALGRVFTPEQDDRVYKGHPVVVLSYPYWVSRFGADRGAIGRKVLVNNYPMTIVGVSAPGFSGLDPARSPQIRIPIQMKPLMTPASDNLGDRRRQWAQIFARMKPGYSMRSAQASLQPLLNQILHSEAEMPALRNTPKPAMERFLARRVMMESAATGYSDLRTSYSSALIALMGMVGLVLLIACFNVACLLLARAAVRKKEFAMRLAIGASRGQLARQLLMESALLAAVGALAGLLVSAGMVGGLIRYLPSNGMLLTLSASPDFRVLGFAAFMATTTVLLFGLAPARQALRVDLIDALKQGSGATGGIRAAVTLRKFLVAGQVAFSFLLVAGALLFAKTLTNLKRTDSGIRSIDRLITFQVDPARNGYSMPRLNAFYEQALAKVRAAPGVKSAGYAWIQVLSNRMAGWDIAVEGQSGNGNREAFINSVSPGYWRTMGIPLVAGRDFDAGDVDGRPKVAIVNRKFASDALGGANPVGVHIGLDTGPNARRDIEIVGVVEDALDRGPRQGIHRQVFFPYPQLKQPVAVTFYVRTAGEEAGIKPALRRGIGELDPGMPMYEMKTVEEQLNETLGTERLTAALSAATGCLATLLAAVGLYGVMALTVTRRTREIGLRMAVGAGRGGVVWMVLREALTLAGVGLGVGMPAAYLLSRWVASQMYGVAADDFRSAGAAAAILAGIAVVAGLLPAYRASTIDPIQALRHE
jgi:predicted permease